MPRIPARLLILLFALPAFAMAADCTPPEPPKNLPDGETASKEAMIEGQQKVQAYVQDGDAYIACMDQAADETAAELRALRESEDANERTLNEREAKLDELIDDRNAVVDEMKHIADSFNAEIDEFQSQGSDDS